MSKNSVRTFRHAQSFESSEKVPGANILARLFSNVHVATAGHVTMTVKDTK